MKRDSESHQVPFYEGRAIESFSDDSLGRKPFAKFFAEAISRHAGTESLVLAINGPWGDGKTSFKNMALDILKQEHSDRVVVLNFTPWEWASQQQVASAFFTEIAKQLELKDKSTDAQRASGRLRAISRCVRLSKFALPGLGMIAEGLLPGSTAAGKLGGAAASKIQELLDGSVDDLEAAAKDENKSLATIKEELRAALQSYVTNQKKLILVVIDDIDRLEPEEIRLVLQMVRANGDFPGLVYLLLYDTDFVLKALERLYSGSEKEFLEKIVQFEIRLPVPLENQLRDHVIGNLARLFAHRPGYTTLIDSQRFLDLWAAGLEHFIKNLRQADRLLSSLSFHMGVFRSEEAEVNPLDLMVLECFRLKDPKLYEAVRTSTAELFPPVDIATFYGMGHSKRKPWNDVLKDIAAAGQPGGQLAAQNLLKQLFPELSASMTMYSTTTRLSKSASERRICNILYFHRYFRLTVDSEDLADEKVSQLAIKMDSPSIFISTLDTLEKESKLSLALTKLLARPDLKSSNQPSEFISVIADWINRPQSHHNPANHIAVPTAVQELIRLQIPEDLASQERFERFSNGIKAAKSIHPLIRTMRRLHNDEHVYPHLNARERKGIEKPLDKNHLDQLDALLAEKLEIACAELDAPFSAEWVQSYHWYFAYNEKRMQAHRSRYLNDPKMLAIMLLTTIDDQCVEYYAQSAGNFPKSIIEDLKKIVSVQDFKKSLTHYAAELGKFGEGIAKRLSIYRDVLKKTSKRKTAKRKNAKP